MLLFTGICPCINQVKGHFMKVKSILKSKRLTLFDFCAQGVVIKLDSHIQYIHTYAVKWGYFQLTHPVWKSKHWKPYKTSNPDLDNNANLETNLVWKSVYFGIYQNCPELKRKGTSSRINSWGVATQHSEKAAIPEVTHYSSQSVHTKGQFLMENRLVYLRLV